MPGATPGDIPPPLSKRPATVPLRNERLRRIATVTTLTPRTSPSSLQSAVPADPDRLKLAVWMEARFHEDGLTLADPETAAALRAGLRCLGVLFDGARNLGELDKDGETLHAYLRDILNDARQAPDLI